MQRAVDAANPRAGDTIKIARIAQHAGYVGQSVRRVRIGAAGIDQRKTQARGFHVPAAHGQAVHIHAVDVIAEYRQQLFLIIAHFGTPAATVAFVHHGTAHLLPPELRTRLLERRHPPQQVLRWLSEWLREQRQRGTLQPVLHASLEDSLDALSMAIGSCERIASTPLPFTYSVILHRTAYFYCMLLPFGLVDAIGAMTPLVVAFVSYTFFALESLSDELEEPFGREQNDLALDAMVRTIEISMCELLDEPPPPALQPDANYVLN